MTAALTPGVSTKAGIVVLGMHRSGTSAVAGAVQSMGAYVGESHELVGKNQENIHGFFERRDVRGICDQLLQGSGADWWRVSHFVAEHASHESVAAQCAAIQLLSDLLKSRSPWVLKEPRLCVLLPFFRSLLNEAVIVFVYRNPVQVARSLQRRNGFPLLGGVALWEVYNRAALRYSAGYPRILMDYDLLVTEPAATLSRLNGQLRSAGVDGLHEADVAAVDPSQHREAADPHELEHWLSRDQLSLWQCLSRGETGTQQSTLSERALARLQAFESDMERCWRAAAEEASLRRRIRSLQRRRARNAGKLNEMKARLSSAEAASKNSRDLADRLSERLQQCERRWHAMQKSSSWRVTAPARALVRRARRLRNRVADPT